MNIEEFRAYCIAKPGTTEELPFDNRTLVFKVMGKMYALCDIEAFESINLKCDSEKAITLREEYSGITPGYHMNKKHWNTVLSDGAVSDKLLKTLIDDSYNLVAAKLTKKLREELAELASQN